LTKEFTYQLNDLDSLATKLLGHFRSKIVLFSGEMGSGKTTLIKYLLKAMGSEDQTHSPSFSLVNEYLTAQGTVHHFDLYRIEDPTEVWDIGFEDYVSSNNWLFIEWPELIKDMIPSNYSIIDIKMVSESSRSLKLTINKELLTENLAMTDR